MQHDVRLTLLTLLLLAVPAWGAPHYFSNCAAGGTGTTSDPYCVDPDSDDTDESIDFLFDGTGTEAAGGDTIYLCCVNGATKCDTTSCTYYLEPSHTGYAESQTSTVAIDPDINAAITIRPYCSGGVCATVTFSGDSDQGGDYDSATEPGVFWNSAITTTTAGGAGFQILGDPDDTGTRHIIIEKFANSAFNLPYIGAGSQTGNMVIDDVEVRYIGAGNIGNGGAFTDGYYDGVSGDGGLWAAGCSVSQINASLDAYSIANFAHWRNNQTLTMRNNYFHHSCAIAFRYNGNCSQPYETCSDGIGSVLVEDGTFWILHALGNGHEGRNYTFRRNSFTEFFEGLGFEQNITGVTVEDNTIGNTGGVRIGDATYEYRSKAGLYVKERGSGCDESGSPICNTQDIIFRRNYIFNGGVPGSSQYLEGGIGFAGHNATSDQGGGLGTSVIENNIIVNIQHNSGCNDFHAALFESPLGVHTSDALVVQNNTLYRNECAMQIGSGCGVNDGGTGAVNHTIRNNLVVRHDGIELDVCNATSCDSSGDHSDATGSTISYNYLTYSPEAAENVATLGSTGYSCASWDAYGDATNLCAATTELWQTCNEASLCVTVDTDWPDQNLRLQAGAAAIDVGTTGATNDIDSQTRSGTTDIGADEYQACHGDRS